MPFLARIFCISFLCFLCLFSFAHASDFYLGVYEDGREAYLDTESIRDHQMYRNGYFEGNIYNCTVKSVERGTDSFEYISYEVHFYQSVFLSKNGIQQYTRLKEIEPYYNTHPVEKNLVRYIQARYER